MPDESTTGDRLIEKPAKKSPFMGFRALRRMFSLSWWTFALAFVWQFKKHVLKPSVMIGIGLTLPYIGFDLSMRRLTTVSGPINGMGEMAVIIGSALAISIPATIISAVLAAWGIGACLIAYTALCRTYLLLDRSDPSKSIPVPDERDTDRLAQESKQIFLQKKAYLIIVWLMYSVYMIPPSIPYTIAGSLLALGAPQMGGLTILPLNIQLPPAVMVASGITLVITILIMTNYGYVLLPYSATQYDLKSTKVSFKGFVSSLRNFPALTIYSALALVATCILSFPVDLVLLAKPALGQDVFLRYIAFMLKALFHVLFFLLIVPLSLLVPCEMVRDDEDNEQIKT